jgi:hypothetical protein
LPSFLGICSSLSTFFFWLEACSQVEDGINLKMSQKIGAKFKIATLVISMVVVLLDLYTSIGTVLGILPGNVTLIPSAIYLLFLLSMAISILKVIQ